MQTKITIRGQTVIPKEIRDKFKINPKKRLEWLVDNGMIVVIPLSEDPVEDAYQCLKGTKVSTDELLKARREGRVLEAEREKRLR